MYSCFCFFEEEEEEEETSTIRLSVHIFDFYVSSYSVCFYRLVRDSIVRPVLPTPPLYRTLQK